MRDFLYNFVYTNPYRYIDNFVSGNNNISVFVYDENSFTDNLQGNGTKSNPYKINTKEELVNWAMWTNQTEPRKNVYFQLASDIDLNQVIWIPAGYYNGYSDINLEMKNHSVININSIPNRYNLGETLIATKQ